MTSHTTRRARPRLHPASPPCRLRIRARSASMYRARRPPAARVPLDPAPCAPGEPERAKPGRSRRHRTPRRPVAAPDVEEHRRRAIRGSIASSPEACQATKDPGEEPARGMLVGAVPGKPCDLRGHVAGIEIAAGQLTQPVWGDLSAASSHAAPAPSVQIQGWPKRVPRTVRLRPGHPAGTRTTRRGRRRRRRPAHLGKRLGDCSEPLAGVLLRPSRLGYESVWGTYAVAMCSPFAAIACAHVPCEPTSTPTTRSWITRQLPGRRRGRAGTR